MSSLVNIGMVVNDDKTEIVNFGSDQSVNVRVGNTDVTSRTTMKALGVMLDSK